MAAIIDCHVHVGLLGDEHPEWGGMSPFFRRQFVYQVFLLYVGISPEQASDKTLYRKIVDTLAGCRTIRNAVCLALDPVYTMNGSPDPTRSHLWVSNDFILELQRDPDLAAGSRSRVLFGASVHPYDPEFQQRVRKYVDAGAVLLKWVPSAQQIDLADPRVRSALTFLARAKDGGPLPLLLHCGREYAIPTTDGRSSSNDFLEWGWTDTLGNFVHNPRWKRPRIVETHANLQAGLNEGAVIIFAHLGLPYYFSGWFGRIFEHSDFDTVRQYLAANGTGRWPGQCYADVSALCTPVRQKYFETIKTLPQNALLFGSDFPTPAFDLTLTTKDIPREFEKVVKGDLRGVVIPPGNLMEVNYDQLHRVFGDHAMFTNFSTLSGVDA